MDFDWFRLLWEMLLVAAAFFLGYNWRGTRRKLPALAIGDAIRIDGKWFKLERYEHASGGVMDTSTVYVFVDMTLEEMDMRGIRRPKGWRKGKNGRLY